MDCQCPSENSLMIRLCCNHCKGLAQKNQIVLQNKRKFEDLNRLAEEEKKIRNNKKISIFKFLSFLLELVLLLLTSFLVCFFLFFFAHSLNDSQEHFLSSQMKVRICNTCRLTVLSARVKCSLYQLQSCIAQYFKPPLDAKCWDWFELKIFFRDVERVKPAADKKIDC